MGSKGNSQKHILEHEDSAAGDMRLEELLKASRPGTPDLPPDYSLRVMETIQREGLAVRPKWVHQLRRGTRRAAILAALLAGVVFSDALAFEVSINGSLELLHFGTRYLGDFLAKLPLDLLLGSLLFTTLAAWLMAGGGPVRARMAWVVLFSYALSATGGATLAETGINEVLQETVVSKAPEMPVLGHFFRRRARYATPHPHLRMGRVTGVENGTATLITPDEETVEVKLPRDFRPRVDEHLRLRGMMRDRKFQVEEGQRLPPRRLGRYFRHHRRMHRPALPPQDQSDRQPDRQPAGPEEGPGMRHNVHPDRMPAERWLQPPGAEGAPGPGLPAGPGLRRGLRGEPGMRPQQRPGPRRDMGKRPELRPGPGQPQPPRE